MRWTKIIARLRRPLTVTASVAVAVGVMLPTGVQAPERVAVRRVVATPVPIPIFEPAHVAIPKIGVDAGVVPVQTEPDGTMGSPGSAEAVGWWFGRKAGEGNLLLDGHHDWNGKMGSFYRLGELEPGDVLVVKGPEDQTLTYEIVWVRSFDRDIDATELLGNDGGKQVATLITCEGEFDTVARTRKERLVARAELVST